MDKLLTVMNFSHVYENEKFYLSEEYNWVDCTNIIGTNGYCDESALVVLKEKVQAIKAEGIHFIYSGNYHYISHLWLEKIVEDFILDLENRFGYNNNLYFPKVCSKINIIYKDLLYG